jgi:hypothetical protein
VTELTGVSGQRPAGTVIPFPAVAPLLERRPARWGLVSRRPARWGLVSAAAAGARGRRAIVQIDGSHTVCLIADVPIVGDLIHGSAPAVVDRVRVTRYGVVRVFASRIVTASVADRRSVDTDRRVHGSGLAANETRCPGDAT